MKVLFNLSATSAELHSIIDQLGPGAKYKIKQGVREWLLYTQVTTVAVITNLVPFG